MHVTFVAANVDREGRGSSTHQLHNTSGRKRPYLGQYWELDVVLWIKIHLLLAPSII